MKPKYSIEITLNGEDLTGLFGGGRFIGADLLFAEGDWITDLLEDATVSTCDQDGGEGPLLSLDDLPERLAESYRNRIREKFRQILADDVAREVAARGPTAEQRHHADMFRTLAEIILKGLPNSGPLHLECDPRTGEVENVTKTDEGED